MYHTTGFKKDDIIELCALIHTADRDGWPPILGLFKSVVVALTYLRRNHVQQELAEYYAVSQSTISRAITAVTPRLGTGAAPVHPDSRRAATRHAADRRRHTGQLLELGQSQRANHLCRAESFQAAHWR
jgi:hypothetical protein